MNKQYHDHLGFNGDYYWEEGEQIRSSEDFSVAIQKSHKLIDIKAVVQFFNHYYFLGDRTLIQGIRKWPWMAKPIADSSFDYYDLPNHGKDQKAPHTVAEEFYKRLRQELLSYIEGSRDIGILLSGGMDSRVVATVLYRISKEERPDIRVTAFNWGIENSRDKVYAERICEKYGWELKYFDLNAEVLLKSVKVTAYHGVEFSPVHVHGMHLVRDMEGIDCILAGSYGDSIGRGEYSGLRVSQLPSLRKRTINWFHLLNRECFKKNKDALTLDVNLYRERFSRKEEYQYREVERQCHYMRRMLNPCMGIIEKKIPVYQAFTSPGVFGFMWGLDVALRNDQLYYDFLKMYDQSMLNIPWARTGKVYLSDTNSIDSYTSMNNRYGHWIRNELYSYVYTTLRSEEFSSLQLFNQSAVNSLLKRFQRDFHLPRRSKLDEFLMWLCALTEAVGLFGIKSETCNHSRFDYILGSLATPVEARLFAELYKKRHE